MRWMCIAIAAGGAAIALFAPASELENVRAWLIGSAIGPFRHHAAHRLTAALGALLGALVLWRLLRMRATERPRLRWLGIGAAIFAAIVFLNVRWAGFALRVWGWWWPWLGTLYYPALAALVIYMTFAARRSIETHGLLLPVGAGVAYGAYSTLWHCCCALWDTPYGHGALHGLLAALVTGAGALAFVGFVGAAPARVRWPWSGLIGATLLGFGYSWHTPAFFVQCLLGGALAVWMVQTTGNLLAGGVFLAAAFEAHLTLPYIGYWACFVPLAFLLVVSIDTLPRDGAIQRRSRPSRVR